MYVSGYKCELDTLHMEQFRYFASSGDSWPAIHFWNDIYELWSSRNYGSSVNKFMWKERIHVTMYVRVLQALVLALLDK